MGFTVIELIVIIVIIAILVLIAMMRLSSYIEKAKIVHIKNDIKVVENAVHILKHKEGKLPLNWDSIHYSELEKTELYNKKGLVKYISDNEFKKISYKFVKGIGVKTQGTFYVDENLNVYYEKRMYCETFVNVVDYGIIGDNKTDNYIQLQNLVDSLKPDDQCFSKIYFPKGIYIISKQINIPSNLILYGEGNDSIIKLANNVDNTNIFYSGDSKNIKIQNLTLDGNIQNQANVKGHTTCIQFHNVENLKLTNLTVKGSLIDGIYLYKNNNFVIDNIVSCNHGHPKVDASGLNIDSSQNGLIFNVVTYNNGFHGILISDSNNLKVHNLVAYDNAYDGIRIQWQSTNNLFTNIKAHGNTRGIYFIEESNNNTVYNSSFNYNSGNGISSNKSQENEFINVHSSYNDGYGIETVTSEDIIYYDNLYLEKNQLGNKFAPGSQFIQY